MSGNYKATAKRLRVGSIVMFVVAGFFALAGITLWIAAGSWLNLITILSSIIIVTSGLSLRTSAQGYDRLARGDRY